MSIPWGSFRQIIRRSILKDSAVDEETGEYRWSDSELLDAASWALDAFAMHTAIASGTGYEGDGERTRFPLPSNLFTAESFDETGRVILVRSSGAREYLDPIRLAPLLSMRDEAAYGFYTQPEDPLTACLRVRTIPGMADRVEIGYYAAYPRPAAESDPILIPQWAEGPVAHLIGYYALSSASLKTSFIRQWGARPDTGNPEHNPVQRQQAAFLDVYERALLRHPPQQRKTTAWRDDRG